MITVLLAEEYLSTWNSGARMEYQVHILLLAQQTWHNASYGPPYKGTAQPQNSIVPRLRNLVLWFAEYFPLASCPVPLRRKNKAEKQQHRKHSLLAFPWFLGWTGLEALGSVDSIFGALDRLPSLLTTAEPFSLDQSILLLQHWAQRAGSWQTLNWLATTGQPYSCCPVLFFSFVAPVIISMD